MRTSNKKMAEGPIPMYWWYLQEDGGGPIPIGGLVPMVPKVAVEVKMLSTTGPGKYVSSHHGDWEPIL